MSPEDAKSWFRRMTKEELGDHGERVCKSTLLASGVHYIPLTDIDNGGAPMMVGATEKIVLPDFECVAPTWTAYIDAKAKTQSVLFRMRNQERHGINKSNFADYLKCTSRMRKHCGLFIVEHWRSDGETWSGALLCEAFRNIGDPIPGIPGAETPEKVYWPRKQLCELHVAEPDELVEIAKGRVRVNVGFALEKIFNPWKQAELF